MITSNATRKRRNPDITDPNVGTKTCRTSKLLFTTFEKHVIAIAPYGESHLRIPKVLKWYWHRNAS
eukprot:5039767-Amphidinium_carterae.2